MSLRLSTSHIECALKVSGLSLIVIAFSGQNITQRWHATHFDESGTDLSVNVKAPKPQFSTHLLQRLHLS
jgi:hypothetical protein